MELRKQVCPAGGACTDCMHRCGKVWSRPLQLPAIGAVHCQCLGGRAAARAPMPAERSYVNTLKIECSSIHDQDSTGTVTPNS